MSSTAQVHLANEQDLPRLQELLTQLPLTPPEVVPVVGNTEPRALRQVAADSRQQLFVLEADGAVVEPPAYLVLPNLTHEGHPYAIVENVVIDAACRGNGYGEILMRHIMDTARSVGCYKLALTSNERRDHAHRFYERLGFRTTQRAFRLNFE